MGSIAKAIAFLMLCASAFGQMGHKHLLIAPRPGSGSAFGACDTNQFYQGNELFGIPSMVFWMRAGDQTYKDSGTTLATNLDGVYQVKSRTNSYWAVQTTASRRPSYLCSAGPNGTPTFLFTNFNNCFLTCATGVQWAQSNTVYILFYQFSDISYFIMDSTNGSGRAAIYSGSGPPANVISYYFGGPGSFPNAGNTMPVGSWNYAECVCKNTDGLITFNSGTPILMNGNSAGSQPIDGLTIGGRVDQNSSVAFDGYISEIMVFNGPFSITNRLSVSNYFNKRYGL